MSNRTNLSKHREVLWRRRMVRWPCSRFIKAITMCFSAICVLPPLWFSGAVSAALLHRLTPVFHSTVYDEINSLIFRDTRIHQWSKKRRRWLISSCLKIDRILASAFILSRRQPWSHTLSSRFTAAKTFPMGSTWHNVKERTTVYDCRYVSVFSKRMSNKCLEQFTLVPSDVSLMTPVPLGIEAKEKQETYRQTEEAPISEIPSTEFR